MVQFSGSLPPKKKSELVDIAAELKIDTGGTKDDLQERIKRHLAANPKLEDDERFSGLYGKKKRQLTKEPSPETKVVVDIPTRHSRHKPASKNDQVAVLPSTPLNRHEPPNGHPSPVAEEDEEADAAQVPLPPSVILSPTRSVISEFLEKARAVAPETELMAQLVQDKTKVVSGEADKLLSSSRIFLSNAKNISSITVLLELLFIIYNIVPWNYYPIPLNPPYSVKPTGPIPSEANPSAVPLVSTRVATIPYPPLDYVTSSAPYITLLLWSIPTLIVPQIFGTLISFRNKDLNQESDPLTAAIIRVACALAGDWNLGDWTTTLRITKKWRLLSACVACAFALAEAVGERKKVEQFPDTESEVAAVE
ncbi:hypothetical protein FRC02_012129 [Tulasnella sp. 418]|nr:hypothetical protein FRC02_012129 [Tulasnella sp. 418]